MEAPEYNEVNSVEGVLAFAKRTAGDEEESVNGEGGALRPALAVAMLVSPSDVVKLARAASMKPGDRQTVQISVSAFGCE